MCRPDYFVRLSIVHQFTQPLLSICDQPISVQCAICDCFSESAKCICAMMILILYAYYNNIVD